MAEDLLKSLEGRWEGSVQTWFEPGKLADESEVTGEFRRLSGGPLLRHTYDSKIQGKPRRGEETIARNGVTGRFEVAWFDDFHMNYAIMFSTGEARPRGFSVTGRYEIEHGAPAWGWRTEYELLDADHLAITAFNVTRDGREAKAVETSYVRVRE